MLRVLPGGGSFVPLITVLCFEIHLTWMLTEKARLLLQKPKMLNAFLTISISWNWLAPTLSVMCLHAYLTQALLPGKEQIKFMQLPVVKLEEQCEVGGIVKVLE